MRDAVLHIDRGALQHNLQRVRDLIDPQRDLGHNDTQVRTEWAAQATPAISE